jgi:hypothetical protein
MKGYIDEQETLCHACALMTDANLKGATSPAHQQGEVDQYGAIRVLASNDRPLPLWRKGESFHAHDPPPQSLLEHNKEHQTAFEARQTVH